MDEDSAIAKLAMQNRIDLAYWHLDEATQIGNIPFHQVEPGSVSEAIFIKLMITLRDVLVFLDESGHRVDFSDDFPDGDITDNVRRMRNACCHSESKSRDIFKKGTTFPFSIRGPNSQLTFRNGVDEFECINPYNDDIAFFCGRVRLFQDRHIKRATSEAKRNLDKLAAQYDVTPPSAFGKVRVI